MISEKLMQQAEALRPQIVADRRFLHTHPGTGFDIGETADYVEQALREMGYRPERVGKAGVVALAGGKKPGKVFLLRADMDALPMREEADVPFRSENGRMHACGHDLHTAMLLGAARLLKEYEDEIPGTVKLMFQPAEEIFEGAHDMIEAGVLENPKVDAALMIHVMANAPLPDGTVLVSAPGVSAPAADTFTIRIQGKGCHGSMPNTGVDPLIPAAQILLALQELQTRELSVSDRSVLTIGVVQAGTAPNIIPDSVTMSGTIRTYDEAVRSLLKKRMKELSAGIAAAFRASVEVTFGSGCPPLRNDPALSEAATRYAKELLGEQKAMSVVQLTAMSAGSSSGSKSAGSEDFAYVSQAVPSIMLALMAGQAADGCGFPQHHPQVRFSEEVLAAGAAVYAYLAMRWLEEQAEQQGIL